MIISLNAHNNPMKKEHLLQMRKLRLGLMIEYYMRIKKEKIWSNATSGMNLSKSEQKVTE